jgi:hypothetical protein
VACGRATDKRELVRFIRTAEGYVGVDPTGKANGRGAYVCPQPACFESAIGKRRLASALRASLSEEDVERLRDEFEDLVRHAYPASQPGR